MNFSLTTIWTGNTYPIRSELKDLGAEWNADRKSWSLPPVVRSEAVRAQRLALKPGVEVAYEEAKAGAA